MLTLERTTFHRNLSEFFSFEKPNLSKRRYQYSGNGCVRSASMFDLHSFRSFLISICILRQILICTFFDLHQFRSAHFLICTNFDLHYIRSTCILPCIFYFSYRLHWTSHNMTAANAICGRRDCGRVVRRAVRRVVRRAVRHAVRRTVRRTVRREVRRAVGCVCASSLGRRAGSVAASCVAGYGCVSASSLVRAGRQRRQRVNQETRLG